MFPNLPPGNNFVQVYLAGTPYELDRMTPVRFISPCGPFMKLIPPLNNY